MNGVGRYKIKAKRTNKKEPWTDWASAETYERAQEIADRVEKAGYSSKIVDKLGKKYDRSQNIP